MHKLRWLHERFHGFTDCWFIYMITTLQLLKCELQKHPPGWSRIIYKADSRLAPSQWETSLQSNAVSHWLGANLESVLIYLCQAITKHSAHYKESRVFSLQWRHDGRDSVSNHQPHDCLLNRLIKRTSNKTSKLRVTGLCAGNSPGTGEFPAQMASNAENVSIWWRHHVSSFCS